jgi:hypothetical protein
VKRGYLADVYATVYQNCVISVFFVNHSLLRNISFLSLRSLTVLRPNASPFVDVEPFEMSTVDLRMHPIRTVLQNLFGIPAIS